MPKTQPNSSETATNNVDDLRALKAIFAPTDILTEDAERQRNLDRFNRRNTIITFIADAYFELLGTSTEFDIGLCDPEPLGDGLFRRDVVVTGPREYDLFADGELVDKVWRALVEIDLPGLEKNWILSGVIDRIESKCTLTYQFVNDQLHILTDGILPIKITEDDVVSPPGEKQPETVVTALANLRYLERRLAIHRLESELASLSLPDQLIEVRRRLPVAAAFRPGYRQVLEEVEEGLKRKVKLEQQRKVLHESIQGKEIRKSDVKETSGESDLVETENILQKKVRNLEAKAEAKQKEIDEKIEENALLRGLTIRRLMFLLDSEMPIFKRATTGAARGELAYMLTGLGGVKPKKGDKIRQQYSTYSRTVNDEDRQWLKDWKAKLQKVPRTKGGTL